jgi:hypothetical protein
MEKFILKQSDKQYKIGIIIEQLKLLLAYWQDDGVTNVSYYDWFKTRVNVTEHIGVSFDNPEFWDWKSQELHSTDYELLSDTVKEAKVKEDVKQAFLAYLFFINSNNKKHSQLKKTVANNHAKGDAEAYPSSCHATLTLMNNFNPLVIKGAAPVAAQGTAFAQKQKQKVAGTPATECNYNKEYFGRPPKYLRTYGSYFPSLMSCWQSDNLKSPHVRFAIESFQVKLKQTTHK